jgi:hypothetical protein
MFIRSFIASSSLHSSWYCNNVLRLLRQPWLRQRSTWKSITWISNSESEHGWTSDPTGVVRNASTAASSPISEMVVHGLDPDISRLLSPLINTAAHPPGPGFPITEPSVKT